MKLWSLLRRQNFNMRLTFFWNFKAKFTRNGLKLLKNELYKSGLNLFFCTNIWTVFKKYYTYGIIKIMRVLAWLRNVESKKFEFFSLSLRGPAASRWRREAAAGRGWSAPPSINQFSFFICETHPSINTGYWSVPQRVGEEQQEGDDQHLLQSINFYFLCIKSFLQSIQVICQSHRE
jgi:hypothetical protein